MEHSWKDCTGEIFEKIKNKPQRVAEVGDYTDVGEDCEYCADDDSRQYCSEVFAKAWKLGRKRKEIKETEAPSTGIILNHTRKEAVILSDYNDIISILKNDKWDSIVYPINILCSTSNGKGLGDYKQDCPFASQAGRWMGNVLEYREEEEIPEDYHVLPFVFIEGDDLKDEYASFSQEALETLIKALYKRKKLPFA